MTTSSQIELQSDEQIERSEDGQLKVVKKKARRIDVDWQGTKLILPNGMDYEEAILALQKRRDEDNQTVEYSYVIRAFPPDGAVALQKALREKYGWTSLVPRQTFWGPKPPTLIPVDIGFNESIQVPWGELTVPNIKGSLYTGWKEEDGLPQFELSAEIRRADKAAFEEIVELTKKYVKEESIYKGQAIKLKFRDNDGDVIEFHPGFCPKFMDLKAFDVSELVFPEDTTQAIQINLWNPILYSDYCRMHNIPLKRGVLLEGGYGTGKTLAAYQTAQLCVDNNWTFVLLDDVRDIHQALQFARMYEPCVIFAEDIDKAASGTRTNEINRIFNTIDGIESKGHDIMTVLTTNLVGSIHPGFIRPGRIDSIITVGPPDAAAIVKLVRRYSQDSKGRPLVAKDVDDSQIVEAMQPVLGANAAFIREVVERSKLAALSHADGTLEIKAIDLDNAAKSMITHLQLVNPKEENEVSTLELMGEQVTSLFADKFIDTLADPVAIKRIATSAKKKFGKRS